MMLLHIAIFAVLMFYLMFVACLTCTFVLCVCVCVVKGVHKLS